MPTIYNGCGTWYYGKSNVETRQGVCQQCGREGPLKSYDTRLFVVVLMIPVFPLGRKRIMDDCPNCKRHRLMAQDEWSRARQRVADASQAYERKPEDPDLAREALAGIANFTDRDRLAVIGPLVERSFAGDAKVLAMLSSVHAHLGDLVQSERVCRSALAVEDHNDLREMLGDCLLKQGKTDEAAPMFAHIHTLGVPDRVDHLYRLAMTYQSEGRHEQALTVFDQCATVCPPIAADPTYKALRRASQVNLSSNKPVNADAVAMKAKSAREMGAFLRWGPVVAVVALLAYMGVSWFLASRCEVHLVNGMDKPYAVRVAGVEHQLGPRARTTIRVAEGEVEVEMLNAPPGVDKEVAVIRRPFWSRPVSGRTFVLNPDHTAVVMHVRSFYVPTKVGVAPPPQTSFLGGVLLHEFRGIDYPFKPFPEQISMKSSTRQVVKQGLDLPIPNDQSLVLASMGFSRGAQKGLAAAIARRRLLLQPDQRAMEWMSVLSAAASPQEAAAFLKPRLGDRPIQMAWHRAYQTFAGKSAGEDSIEREYQALLDADPENRDLMYLVGRIAKDPKRARELCDRAASGDKPCAYAIYWQNGRQLATGDLAAAGRLAPRVRALLASEPDVVWRTQQVMAAAGMVEPALEALRSLQKSESSFELPALDEEHYLLTVHKRSAEAAAALTRLRDKLTKMMEAEHVTAYMKRLEAVNAYAQGRPGAIINHFNQSERVADQAMGKLMANDLAGASAKALEAKDQAEPLIHALIVMSSLARQPAAPQAKPHLAHLIDQLGKGTRDNKIIAAALAAGANGPLELDELLESFEEPREKAVYLTIVGLQRPVGSAERGRCLEMARRLNFDRRFPWLTLNAVLDGAGAAGGAPQPANPPAPKPVKPAQGGAGA